MHIKVLRKHQLRLDHGVDLVLGDLRVNLLRRGLRDQIQLTRFNNSSCALAEFGIRFIDSRLLKYLFELFLKMFENFFSFFKGYVATANE